MGFGETGRWRQVRWARLLRWEDGLLLNAGPLPNARMQPIPAAPTPSRRALSLMDGCVTGAIPEAFSAPFLV